MISRARDALRWKLERLLEEEQEQGHTEQEFQALLDTAGKELANEKIGFTGCEVNYLEKE